MGPFVLRGNYIWSEGPQKLRLMPRAYGVCDENGRCAGVFDTLPERYAALPLRDPQRMEAPGYPQDMPATLSELQDLFEQGDPVHAPDYSPRHGRLVVFAPESAGDTWSAIKTWKRAWLVPTRPGGGCAEVELKDAMFPSYDVY